jgi:hypothetical protein
VPASIRAGRPSNTEPTALPCHGGHPIQIVVADDTTFVEHLGDWCFSRGRVLAFGRRIGQNYVVVIRDRGAFDDGRGDAQAAWLVDRDSGVL